MKTIYFHIGAHKTGTTSVQRALSDNAERLRERGFLFPSPGPGYYAHHRLMYGLRRRRDQKTGDIPDPQSEITRIRTEASADSGSAVIISSEGLFSLDHRSIRYLYDQFDGFERRVIAYVRRQDNMIVSTYNQRIKSHKNRFNRDFSRLLENPRAMVSDIDYRGHLDRWSSVFGRDHVVVRCYEAAQDVVADFQTMVGIPIPLSSPDQPVRLNPSLGPVAIRLIRWAKSKTDNKSRLKMLRKVLKLFPARGSMEGIMSVAERRRILELFRSDNEYVFATYMNSPNLYDPSVIASDGA